MRNLSKNLKAVREKRRLSLASFAEEIGISKSTLQEIESGKGTTVGTLDQIAERLNVSAASLLEGNSIHTGNTVFNGAYLKNIAEFYKLPRQQQIHTICTARHILDTLELDIKQE